MPYRTAYRRRLLQAVEAFMDQSPDSIKRAQQIIQKCDSALFNPAKLFTVDYVIWESIVSLLTDSVYYTDQGYLAELRAVLGGLSRIPQRTYLSFDFTAHGFTVAERQLHTRLLDTVDFLSRLPLQNPRAELQEYTRRALELEAAADAIPKPHRTGDEKIYHVVLREALAFITKVDILGTTKHGYLTPALPYSSICERDEPPDVSSGLRWAKRALLALSGQEWISISWVIDSGLLILSVR